LSAHKDAVKALIHDYELSTNGLTKDNLDDVTVRFGDILIHSDDPEVKTYLRDTIESIEVGEDEVTVTLKLA